MHNKELPSACTAHGQPELQMPFYRAILIRIESWETERHVTKIVFQCLINHKLTSGARSARRVEIKSSKKPL